MYDPSQSDYDKQFSGSTVQWTPLSYEEILKTHKTESVLDIWI